MFNDFLDWLGSMINYSILVLIFVRGIGRGYLSVLDISLSAIGLSASLIIFIVKLINKENG